MGRMGGFVVARDRGLAGGAALASDELRDDWSHPEALIWFNVSQFLDRYHFFTLRSSEEDGRRLDEVFADARHLAYALRWFSAVAL